MNKQKWAVVISVVAIAGFWVSQKLIKKVESPDKIKISKIEGAHYWTCPMHPQIHLDHEGECPICHMKLVKVTAETSESDHASDGKKRAEIQINSGQMELVGIRKTKVEKMNLTGKILVSGRVLSDSSVAFQVYEQDLRHIHSGQKFKGESSINPEDPITGIISSVDTIIDPSSRTVRVIGRIIGSKKILSEASFSGEILIVLKDRISIPESSVLHSGHGDLVYIFDNQYKLSAKKVTLGLKTEGYYEILNGLTEGDLISSGPNFLIDSEAKIRGAHD